MKLLALLTASAPVLAAVVSRGERQHVIGESISENGFPSADRIFACDLPPVVSPGGDGLASADELFSGPKALGKQVQRHAAAVQIPTVGYDDNGEVDEDPRWLVFLDFHKLLKRLYPTVHAQAELVKVNRFGLVYVVHGSEPELRPIMLTAHQDVVPVADASSWTYPPFSGHYDGKYLWGRGSSDDKNSLTALMSTLEALLSQPAWKPRRTIVLSFGFDEESSGLRGAGSLSTYLEERFGRDSMVLIIDEGGMGLDPVGNDTLYALPAVTEKGHVDVLYELHVQGGHSSIPFPHTGIGIISEIVTILEANPYTPDLLPNSPIHKHFACQARYSPDADPIVTDLIQKNELTKLAEALAKRARQIHYRLQTSQAVDLIFGGVKINAMPELTTLGVNYRVAPQNSIAEIKENSVRLIEPVVKKYGLTLKAFEDDDSADAKYDVDYEGTLILKTRQATELAPESPTDGPVWDLFSGTIQHTFAFEGGTVVPVGEIMTGNTDTRHYLALSRNIYRFIPALPDSNFNIHTVDEHIDMGGHLELIKFYYNLIRNFDASDA